MQHCQVSRGCFPGWNHVYCLVSIFY
uniref:Uncharacterized protein n=1 Tax=Anguilla anguilla TaxID=7936 RepID=A0A0E9Q6Y7_ANGAN